MRCIQRQYYFPIHYYSKNPLNMRINYLFFITAVSILFIISSCEHTTRKQNSDSGTEAMAVSTPAVDSAALILKDSVESASIFDSLMGKYTSQQRYKVEYAEGSMDGGPKMVMMIAREKEKYLVKHTFKGTVGYGCGGPVTEATAEFLKAEKISDHIFKLSLKKSSCKYSDRAGCDEKNVKEGTPTEDDQFNLTVDLTDSKSIKITSNAVKTKCVYAWEFEGMTFTKK